MSRERECLHCIEMTAKAQMQCGGAVAVEPLTNLGARVRARPAESSMTRVPSLAFTAHSPNPRRR